MQLSNLLNGNDILFRLVVVGGWIVGVDQIKCVLCCTIADEPGVADLGEVDHIKAQHDSTAKLKYWVLE